VLCARREPALQTLANELGRVHGVQCQVVAADLSSSAGTARLMDAVQGVDVGLLVAAAGFGTSGLFLDADLADEEQMLQLNCTSVLQQCRLFAPRFADRGRGGIVLLSSVLAFMGTPRSAHYAATKAYVQSLAEGLREELRPLGIDVLASAPGPTMSGFADRAGLRMTLALQPRVVAAVTLAALGKQGTVRPGWLSKLLGWSLSTAPRWLRVKIIGAVMKGMTAHQQRPPTRRQEGVP
jgi:short-subunit dehydrogenase